MSQKNNRTSFSSVRPWLALLRHFREGRELSRSLRESLLMDDEGWVLRNSAGGSNTIIEYVEGNSGKTRFTVKIVPCMCLRSCQTVQVSVDGCVLFVPLLARILLRNVVRLFVLRYANKTAESTLGN